MSKNIKARYSFSIKTTETRREDPLYSDNIMKMAEAATIFTIRRTPEVKILNTETDELLYLARYGEVKIDLLP